MLTNLELQLAAFELLYGLLMALSADYFRAPLFTAYSKTCLY